MKTQRSCLMLWFAQLREAWYATKPDLSIRRDEFIRRIITRKGMTK